MVVLAMAIAAACSWNVQQQQQQQLLGGNSGGLGLRLREQEARRLNPKRGVLLIAAAKSKKWQWDVWERKEVTLDDIDLMQLEMRRKLGESRDESLAKVIAKKVIPYATNLEVDKIVKQKGLKPFLELLKVEETKESKTAGAKRIGARPPNSLEGLQPPPRRPGAPAAAASARPPPVSDFDWPDEADTFLQPVNQRRFTEDMIQLNPKPRGAAGQPSADNVNVGKAMDISSDSGIPGYKGDKTRSTVTKPLLPPKPAPELISRPARGGLVEAFPAPVDVKRPPRDLPVPSLSTRPAVRLPTPPEEIPAVSSTQREVPDLTLQKPPALAVQKQSSTGENGTTPTQKPIRPLETTAISMTEATPRDRDLPVPSLSTRPAVRLPTPPEIPAVPSTQRAAQKQSSTGENDTTPVAAFGEATLPPLIRPLETAAISMTEATKPFRKVEATLPTLNRPRETFPATSMAEEVIPFFKEEAALPLLNRPSETVEADATGTTEEIIPVHKDEAPFPVLNKPPAKNKDIVMPMTEEVAAAIEQAQAKPAHEETLPLLTKPPAKLEKNLTDMQLVLDDEVNDRTYGTVSEIAALPLAAVLEESDISLRKPFAAAEKLLVEDEGLAREQDTSKLLDMQMSLPTLEPPPSGAEAVNVDKETVSTIETFSHDSKLPKGAIFQEEIDQDWALAEAALETKTTQDVIFIGSNAGGMIARFGCLNGFLPGRDLLETRGLKTFRSWARERGYDVNHVSVWDSSEGLESTFSVSKLSSQGLNKNADSHSLHPACESDINKLYKEYRMSLLSSLVGQRANVTVTLVDRTMKKLVFSERKAVAVNEDVAQRRADLMAKLNAGDIVKGRVRNISLFGVFVELVEGVTGLIHFSELSWTPVTDPAALAAVGQELEVMVLKLDHDRQRINLSLKRLSPDPLLESVESMLARDPPPTDTEVQAPPVPEFDELLKKLESREEIQAATKGRRIHGAAVVPSFQVYLSSSSTLPEGYKLLARIGNEVQEVLLQTSLSRDALIAIIRDSTSTDTVKEQV